MRFQTLRSRSRGGAGEGLSPRPRLLLPGRLRLGEGSPGPVTCQHLLPLAAPGSHSLTPSLSPRCSHHLTAGDGHPGRRKPAHLGLRISRLSARTSVTLGLSLVPCLGNRVEAPLGLAPTHPEEGLLLEFQCLKHLGCQFSLGKPVILGHHSAWHR